MSKKFGRGFSKMLSHFSVESTMDQEFNVTKERADEAERKFHGVVSKISRLKSILLEAAILQVDISLSLSEIASGDKNVVEEVNAFGDVSKEILQNQEQFNKIIFDTIEVPILNFLQQYHFLHRRSTILDKRKRGNSSSTTDSTLKYSKLKDQYIELRNEIIRDRKTLNDVSPKIVREITRLLMSEGCGCLMINQKIGIVECCEIITPTNRSSSNTTQALPKVNTIFNARATYNYNARDQSELTLREGDWVTVLSTEGDWWEGEKNGRIGIFPSNYVVKDVNF
ncbi:hypothetical protein QTN25_006606 [Entamoeba marina]